jgi:hypothetical protein
MGADDRGKPFTMRLGRSRVARSLFLGLATLAASLGFPIKVEPPPPRRTPIEVVRDEDDPDHAPTGGTPRAVR